MNDIHTNKYEDGLKAALLDPDESVAYLQAALEENDPEIFLLALRDVAKAYDFPFDQAMALLTQSVPSQ